MRFPLTQIASLVVVLLTSGGVASAQIGIIDSSRAHPELPNRHPALPDFTMQQRAAIYSAVMEEKSVPSLSMNMRVGIGTKLPESAELHPLPNAIRAQLLGPQPQCHRCQMERVARAGFKISRQLPRPSIADFYNKTCQ